ncbi:hypothetical protein HAX54_047640 [Datura stramonium]|uniref:Uncharacterized protein n=1 Tax=Datura stramonium TaxID=4076 RepID=A0ABS8WN68_DATST|nr:hypothetical protein [Datura stramonium]
MSCDEVSLYPSNSFYTRVTILMTVIGTHTNPSVGEPTLPNNYPVNNHFKRSLVQGVTAILTDRHATDGASDVRQEGDGPSLVMFRFDGMGDSPSEQRQTVTLAVKGKICRLWGDDRPDGPSEL